MKMTAQSSLAFLAGITVGGPASRCAASLEQPRTLGAIAENRKQRYKLASEYARSKIRRGIMRAAFASCPRSEYSSRLVTANSQSMPLQKCGVVLPFNGQWGWHFSDSHIASSLDSEGLKLTPSYIDRREMAQGPPLTIGTKFAQLHLYTKAADNLAHTTIGRGELAVSSAPA